MFFPFKRDRVPVASRNLRADRIRFTVNVIGVAFAVLLICFQLSVLKGTRAQITTYIDHTGADIWAMQKGVDDFIATSAVPRESVDTLERLSGVRRVAGIYAIYTLLEINRVKSRVYVIGYDTPSGDGGPWKLGRTLPHIRDTRSLGQDEVLLDETLARRHGLEPGDRVSLFGRTFTVAGFTLETTSIGSQYAFLPRETIGRILPGGQFSFTHVLVWSNGTVPDRDMVRRIGEATGLSSLTRDALAANMREFLGMFMLPLLTAGVVMGFLVGSITIGITLYTAVLERIKEYGTMKALGATDWFLFGVLLRQSLISLVIGTVMGLISWGIRQSFHQSMGPRNDGQAGWFNHNADHSRRFGHGDLEHGPAHVAAAQARSAGGLPVMTPFIEAQRPVPELWNGHHRGAGRRSCLAQYRRRGVPHAHGTFGQRQDHPSCHARVYPQTFFGSHPGAGERGRRFVFTGARTASGGIHRICFPGFQSPVRIDRVGECCTGR